MNRILKSILILLGLTLIGYAIYSKLSVNSPVSAWENSLANDVTKGDVNHLLAFFKEIIAGIQAGWNAVIVLGLLVFLASCFLKAGNCSDKK